MGQERVLCHQGETLAADDEGESRGPSGPLSLCAIDLLLVPCGSRKDLSRDARIHASKRRDVEIVG
jgi:hypothetical protein